MNIYVLILYDYDDTRIMGVFSNKEEAERVAATIDEVNCFVYLFVLDKCTS